MGRQIELKKITKVFGKLTANSEVDFTVESGKIYGLIGENGAGIVSFRKCGRYRIGQIGVKPA